MARYTWETDPHGTIFVTDSEVGGACFSPQLPPNLVGLMNVVVTRWRPLCEVHAKRTGLPARWLLAMILRESGGNADAVNSNDDPPGLGLLQITSPSLYRGLTRQQVMDPETNIRLGANYLAAIVHIVGRDFPKVSSAFNGGINVSTKSPHTSTKSPWGLVETPGHITEEVAAQNFCVTLGMDDAPPLLTDEEKAAVLAAQSDMTALANEVLDSLRTDHLEEV